MTSHRQAPFGALAAALAAAALVAAAPLASLDREVVEAVRAAVESSPPPVVAVIVDGASADAAAAAARAGGAAQVLGPTTDPLPAPRSAPVGRVTARQLLDGSAPATALAGRIVVIDSATRAPARAAAIAAADTPRPSGATRLALLIAAAVLAFGLALARRRRALLYMGGLAAAALLAGLVAARGFVAPAAELAAVLPLAAIGALSDRSRELARIVRAIAAPVLRASADVGAAARVESGVGPALCALLEARGLLVLECPPGARRVTPGAGWRLTAIDLRPGHPTDPRQAPYRDASGTVRAADAETLIATPATLLPLVARGVLEGFLLVAHERGDAPPAATEAVLAACASLAEELRATRVRASGDSGETLVEAARALDAAAATVTQAATRAATGMALLSAAGLTRWKNQACDDVLAQIAPSAAGDLGRVLSLFRRVGESQLGALQRLLTSDGPSRAIDPDLGLVATVTATPDGLLVELEQIDEATACALTPTPGLAIRAATPAATGG